MYLWYSASPGPLSWTRHLGETTPPPTPLPPPSTLRGPSCGDLSGSTNGGRSAAREAAPRLCEFFAGANSARPHAAKGKASRACGAWGGGSTVRGRKDASAQSGFFAARADRPLPEAPSLSVSTLPCVIPTPSFPLPLSQKYPAVPHIYLLPFGSAAPAPLRPQLTDRFGRRRGYRRWPR